MFLGYFVQADKAITSVLSGIVAIFLMYNIFVNWIGQSASQRLTSILNKNKTSGAPQNHAHRLIMGVGIIIIFFSGSVEKYQIKDITNGATLEAQVKEQRIRDIIRWVFSVSNSLSDELARIGIGSYLKHIATTSGASGVDRIDGYTSEKQILTNENILLKNIESSMCGIYDTERYKEVLMEKNAKLKKEETATSEEATALQAILTTLKQQKPETKDFTAALDLEVNPFPKTEEIAFQTFDNDDSPLNPYSSEAGVLTGGVTSMFMSMSGCYSTRQKILENNGRLKEVEEIIKKIKSDFQDTNNIENVKKAYNIMWKNYHELGYISVAFLPANAFLIDSRGVLGDKYKRDEENLANESLDMSIGKSVVLLSVFNASKIKEIIDQTLAMPFQAVRESYEKSIIGSAIDKVGGAAAKVTIQQGVNLAEYTLIYKGIVGFLNTLVLVVMITSSILAFTLLFLQKFWAFMSVIFIPIYAFHPKQEEKVIAAAGKIIAVAFKTVLLTITMFLVIFSLSLFETLELRLVNDFFVTIQSTPLADTWNPITYFMSFADRILIQYIFLGVSFIVFIFVKIVLIVTIIFKLPGYFYELIDAKVEDMGDKMIDTIQQAQGKTAGVGKYM